jgi:prevent-host-death family protein
MTQIGAYEAKTHLAQLLDRVSSGERIIITRHGNPVAVLVPVGPQNTGEPRDAVAELRRFRRGRKRGPGSLKRMIEEGRG